MVGPEVVNKSIPDDELPMGINPDFKGIYEFAIHNLESSDPILSQAMTPRTEIDEIGIIVRVLLPECAVHCVG